MVGRNGAEALARLLRANRFLTALSLNGSSLGPEIEVICDAADALVFLDVSGNEIGSDGLSCLGKLFERTVVLKHVLANGLSVTHADSEVLLAGLSSNWSLISGQFFFLNDVLFFDQDVEAIFRRNASLHTHVRLCTVVVLAINRFRKGRLGRDCGSILGQMLLKTAADKEAWKLGF